jgi:hypothetical protein
MGTYNEFTNDPAHAHQQSDIILCFANEHDIWSSMQNSYPPVVFHATTSRSWGVNVGRHIPQKEACLMCTFQDYLHTGHKTECAKGLIEVETEQGTETHDGTLPFLSPAAAILTLASLTKLLSGQISKANSLEFGMRTANGRFMTDFNGPHQCFLCKNQHPDDWRELNQNTRY